MKKVLVVPFLAVAFALIASYIMIGEPFWNRMPQPMGLISMLISTMILVGGMYWWLQE